MAHVNITKDLTEVKSKVVFGLTKRQLIFFVLAALVAVPIYFLTRESLGNDIALVLLITTALPFFFFALYEKNGQPPEKILKNYIRCPVPDATGCVPTGQTTDLPPWSGKPILTRR